MKMIRFGCFLGLGCVVIVASLLGASGCNKVPGKGTAESFEELAIAVCAPDAGPFTTEIDAPMPS